MSLELSEEQIRKLMMDDTNRKIAIFCITPHTAQEIVKKIAANYSEEPFRSAVGQALRNLESSTALIFSGDKWKTNQKTVAVLRKYFGTE